MKMLKSTLAAGVVVALALAAGAAFAPAAFAQSAAAKATVDAAKAAGQVGEQMDGYLGLVAADAPPAVRAAVAEINSGRTGAFQAAAAKAGTPVEAAAAATGKQLIDRLPAGQYYKGADGRWVKK
jgi:uncharacterized protein YdbL (DUF1318 family)